MENLGRFMYLRNRPDRDNYINVDTRAVSQSTAARFMPMSSNVWLNTNHPYDIHSVMHHDFYIRIHQSADWDVFMTLKDGRYFRTGLLMTTTDSLQVDEMYCKDFPQYKSKARIQLVSSRLCSILYAQL